MSRTEGVVILAAVVLLAAFPASAADRIYPGESWAKATPAEAGMDGSKLEEARDYALSGGGSGYITRHGRLVMAWGDPRRRYDLKSTTKSIGATALGLAIGDGKVRLSDRARKHHPTLGTPPGTNEATGWLDRITIQALATQTAGFEKPGGYEKLLFEPGTRWLYSDGGPNWLAECITLEYRRDLQDLMFERVFTPLGITRKDLTWRRNAYRPHEIEEIPRREFGSGISANVDAMARIGYLYLRRGRWRETEILPATFVDQARTTVPGVVGLPEHETEYNEDLGNASDHYGLLWWNNADGTLDGVPRSTYWSWGLYDSLIVVFPDLDVVAARAGKSWKRRSGAGHYDVLRPFLRPIAESVAPGDAILGAGGVSPEPEAALASQAAGIAARYPLDAGIAKDPDVILADDFESWQEGGSQPPPDTWNLRTNRTSRTHVIPGRAGGWGPGGSILEIACWTTGSGSQVGGISRRLGNYNHAREGLGDGYDELYVRYYIRFDEDYRAVRNHGANLGGRDLTRKDAAWVGMAGIRDVSTRGYFYSGVQPRGEPGARELEMGFYSYHLDKRGPWGENYEVRKRISVPVGKWVCVERRMKLNSVSAGKEDPANADGIEELWIDGELSIRKEGVRFRRVPHLRITFFSLETYYHGLPEGYGPDHPIKVHFDNVVIARRYIGPMAGAKR